MSGFLAKTAYRMLRGKSEWSFGLGALLDLPKLLLNDGNGRVGGAARAENVGGIG